MPEWNPGCHSKYLLQYYLIFIYKYGKRLLSNPKMIVACKKLSFEICSKYKAIIKQVETDKDHIYYRIETTANINQAAFVEIMKSCITYHKFLHCFHSCKIFCHDVTTPFSKHLCVLLIWKYEWRTYFHLIIQFRQFHSRKWILWLLQWATKKTV